MPNFENRVRSVIEREDVPPLSTRNNQADISDESQLPAVKGGTRTLDDIAYVFDGNVDVSEPLEYSQGTGIYGVNWPKDQINYTGSETLFQGTDVDIMMRNIVTLCPTGTLFDVSGTVDDRFLVQSCALLMTDDLGTIDGFKVPGTKLTDITNFNKGFTYTGNPEKVYFTTCPFRDASGASGTNAAIYFDENFETDFIQIDNSFFKSFNNDSDAINFNSSATLNEFGIIKGNIFDDSVQNKTINFDETTAGWDFIANNGIANSREQAQVAVRGNSTITDIQSSGQYIKVAGTSVEDYAQRFSMTDDLEITYTGKRPVRALVRASITALGADNIYEFAFFKNDSVLTTSETEVSFGRFFNNNATPTIFDFVQFNTGDTIDLRVKNNSLPNGVTVSDVDFIIGQ